MGFPTSLAWPVCGTHSEFCAGAPWVQLLLLIVLFGLPVWTTLLVSVPLLFRLWSKVLLVSHLCVGFLARGHPCWACQSHVFQTGTPFIMLFLSSIFFLHAFLGAFSLLWSVILFIFSLSLLVLLGGCPSHRWLFGLVGFSYG